MKKIARALGVAHWLNLVCDDDRAAYLNAKDPEYHGWGAIEGAAKTIGREIFNSEFNANIILTFSGHSWIFASLVLAFSRDRDRLLNIPIYVALTMDWDPSDPIPRLAGFTALPWRSPSDNTKGRGFVVFMPENFPKADGNRRVAVIDDSITSGAVHLVVGNHLRELKYRTGDEGTLKTVCCICNTSATLLARPDHYAIATRRERFSYPWGDCIWFPNRFTVRQ